MTLHEQVRTLFALLYWRDYTAADVEDVVAQWESVCRYVE